MSGVLLSQLGTKNLIERDSNKTNKQRKTFFGWELIFGCLNLLPHQELLWELCCWGSVSLSLKVCHSDLLDTVTDPELYPTLKILVRLKSKKIHKFKKTMPNFLLPDWYTQIRSAEVQLSFIHFLHSCMSYFNRTEICVCAPLMFHSFCSGLWPERTGRSP